VRQGAMWDGASREMAHQPQKMKLPSLSRGGIFTGALS